MSTTLESAVADYLRSGHPAQRTREEYATTLRKWSQWCECVPLDQLGRSELREFLNWVYEDAAKRDGRNPLGRPTRSARTIEQLCHGPGSRILSMHCHAFPRRSLSEKWRDDTN